MHKKTKLLAAVALFGLQAVANDIEPSKENYSVPFTTQSIVIDGALGEWSGVPILADPKFSIPKGKGSAGTYVLFEEYGGGTWSGPDDQTSAVQIVYDAENVYFGFVVTDDYHENAANSAWNGDSIQLMIANGDRSAQVALYNYALGGTDGALAETTIVNHEAGPGGTEGVVTRNTATKRTTYEIKLPKAALGITKLAGDVTFGLGMAINDGDEAAGQNGQKGWGGLGAHAIVFGKTPSETALITLQKKNDIEPSKEFYTVNRAPRPVILDGNLDEWSGIAVLADPKFSIPKGSGPNGTYVLFEEYSGGTWSGPDDQTSAVQVIYDAENVYFGFVVTDDYHENAANSAWNGDSIQLMIANGDRTGQVALYNYALGGTDGALAETTIVNHEAGPGGTDAVVKRNTASKRTTYEIKLPLASLGLTNLAGGTKFGLGMAINDGDEAAGQRGQKGWGGLGAHAIVFGKTPSETALFTLSTAAANDIEPGKEYYTATASVKNIVIDGDLGEWTGAPVLSDPKFSIPKGSGSKGSGRYVLFEEYGGGTWSGPDDQTSAVQVIYDADNVYFGFVVTDDYHENSANSAWNGDSIQLMVASADRLSQVGLYNYALGGTDGALADTTIVNHEAGPGGTEAVVKRDTANKRTYYEIKLPATALGLTAPLKLGSAFGLGMAINDGDEAAGQRGQKGWGGLGAHAIVFGKTPSETALVSLGAAATGADRLFLSAINPGIINFSFRVNDKGVSLFKSAKVTIDGQVVTTVSGAKNADATDVAFTGVLPFTAGTHTYALEVTDTKGNIVKDSGTFIAANVAVLTQASQAVSVDKSKKGFIWRVVQNEEMTSADISDAELALVGSLKDANGGLFANLAEPSQVGLSLAPGVKDGATVKFQIDGTINLNSTVNLTGEGSAGSITPDDGMPGVPGSNSATSGIAAEIVTYLQLPKGVITLGISCDDRFRAQAGTILTPADGILLGAGGLELNGNTATGITKFYVQDAGVYPVRIVFQDSGGAAHIEIVSINADGSKVLVNDVASGGIPAYRVGVAPVKSNLAAVGKVPAGMSGVALSGVVLNTATKTITADIPSTGGQGYLTITPSVTILKVTNSGNKLVITYQ